MSKKNGVTKEQFVLKAILKLRKDGYKGIHTVYSGFNEAFREHFNSDPVKFTGELVKAGKIEIRPVRGGVMLYKKGEAPVVDTSQRAKKTVSTILS